MSKKHKAIDELKKAEEEQAAAIAVEGNRGSARAMSSSFKLVGRLLVVVLLMLATAIGTWLFIMKVSAPKQDTTVFVEQVQDLATLATAEAHLKVVIKTEDNKLFGKKLPFDVPGTKRKLLLIVPATVVAGVDLQGITEADVVVHEDKQLELVLPRATFLQQPAIQMDAVETFSEEGLFRSEVKWDEGYDLAAEAQRQMLEEASEMGLLQLAEENAQSALQSFFGHLGYTVTITYK